MNRVRLILGRRGSGKSVLTAGLIAGEPRVIVYNTVAEPTYDDLEPLSTRQELIEVLRRDSSVMRYAYRDPDSDELEDFEFCCKAVWCSHSLEFVVEELGLVCPNSRLPPAMQRIAVAGRHRSITLTAIAQRASLAPATLRATCTELHSFQQTESRDIDGLRDLLGEHADALPELPQYKPLVWTADRGVVSCPLDGFRTGAYKQPDLFDPSEDTSHGKSERPDHDGRGRGGGSGDCE